MLPIRLLLTLLVALLPAAAWAQAPAGAPLMKPALGGSAAAGSYKTINWEALVQPGWDPFKEFRGVDLQGLNDGDPRADALLKKMRQLWDRAPVNPALVGQAVRIPGYVVPLEEGSGGISEFLLVPYFGACVHSPPPPSNQIIHVQLASAAKSLRSMDTVWLSGTLQQVQTDSYMGAASWRVTAARLEPYSEQRPK